MGIWQGGLKVVVMGFISVLNRWLMILGASKVRIKLSGCMAVVSLADDFNTDA